MRQGNLLDLWQRHVARKRRPAVVGCMAVAAIMLAAEAVQAHDLLLSTVELSVRGPSSTGIVVTMPLSELAKVEHAPRLAMTPLDVEVAIRRRLDLESIGRPLAPGASAVTVDASADVVSWRADVVAPIETVAVAHRLLPEEPASYTRVRNLGPDGVRREQWLGTPHARAEAGRAGAGWFERAVGFLALGFRHVMDGRDHIAFIIGLILLGGSLRSVAIAVTSFTLAHSVTLGLAASGLMAPSDRLVEPLIALSIVAIAIENLLFRRGSVGRRPYYAAACGLVHGFGLAGPLHAMTASGEPLMASLLPFNIGVEIAQAAIVLAVWPVMVGLGRMKPAFAMRAAFAASCAIGAAGGWWFVERVAPAAGAALAQTAGSPDEAAARVEATFRPFEPAITTRHDQQFFYVESNGMPDHRMMVGITAWQQQVPLPQNYTGRNAWRFPLFAKPAPAPLSAKDHFFRGAIAIAANGVPIFNPIKNDGHTDTFLAGELDEFGGHGGRADDYHYHLPPLHLQKQLGTALPVAYALDGYPIYGLTEPDGASPGRLDVFNGHTARDATYHYHSTKTYPYLNGGFHGEVTEIDGQVDPQPNAQPVRPSTEPLRGATVTGFEQISDREYTLTYALKGETRKIHYTIQSNGTYVFDYIDGSGQTQTQTYRRGGRGRGRE